MDTPKKILVIRNDRLGDFMLAYPAFNTLKKLFPSAKIYALVPEYTKPMAELCQWIDEIVVDDATKGLSGLAKTTSKLKTYEFDAALCLHSSPRIALSLLLAGIPQRFAPASRLDQIFYNHRLPQRRSRSEKPEYEYNIDLANFMGKYYSLPPTSPDGPPYLILPTQEVNAYRQELYQKCKLAENSKIVIVHPGSGGSAKNLTIEQYAELITLLSNDKTLFFIITAGPGEEIIANQLSDNIKACAHIVMPPTKDLHVFSKLLATAHLFISGSTGVLHIAGALNKSTVAFYPSKRSATALRWQSLNSPQKQLAFTLNDGDVSGIDLILTSETINNTNFGQ